MKIPLLISAKPSLGLLGPGVLLKSGKWIIEAKDLVDSKVNLRLGESILFTLHNSAELFLDVDTTVRIQIIEPGKESSLTIFAISQ